MEDKILYYTHKRVRRSRRVRVLVNCDASVVVTTPVSYPVYLMEGFLKQKIDWIWEKINFWRSRPNMAPRMSVADKRREYLVNKGKARALVLALVERVNNVYNFEYKKITIRDQRTRWGSCARGGSMNFNYRLALIPANLAEYVVAH